jgi:uncharacterized protein
MHYYIDGYNLLFRIFRAGTDIRRQRKNLTLDIEKKVNLLGLDATLVFDSHYQEDDSTKSHLNSLEIIFTAAGETADEFILQKLKESANPSQHTVITSDKKLARLCQLRLGKTEGVDDFLLWINKRYKNKLRQQRLQVSKNPPPHPALEPSVPTISSKPLAVTQNCFDYYLDTFENEFLKLEKQPPISKKSPKQSKKPKVKNRPLTQEEAQFSDFQRWQKAFEISNVEDSDKFIV